MMMIESTKKRKKEPKSNNKQCFNMKGICPMDDDDDEKYQKLNEYNTWN